MYHDSINGIPGKHETQNKHSLFDFVFSSAHSSIAWLASENTKPITKVMGFFCGERGIRTPGGVTLNGFQDRRIRPLCHASVCDLCNFLRVAFYSVFSDRSGDHSSPLYMILKFGSQKYPFHQKNQAPGED